MHYAKQRPVSSKKVNGKSGKQGDFEQIIFKQKDSQLVLDEFLSGKTLKKQFKDYSLKLGQTLPTQIIKPQVQFESQQRFSSVDLKDLNEQKTQKNWRQAEKLTYIDTSLIDVKPAYRSQSVNKSVEFPLKNNFFDQPDSHSIMAMLRKKGVQGIEPKIVINVVKPDNLKQNKKVTPAENRLKSLFRPSGRLFEEPSKKNQEADVAEQIHESIEDEYGSASFQKASNILESMIRESIAMESKEVKESIRESIREEYASSGKIKEQIQEEFQYSIKSLREDIAEEISGSIRKSKESVQEVYEQIFEEESLENSLNKSQNRFKKSLRESDSASKSFRMKTNINKSIKLAEELIKKEIEIESKHDLKADDNANKLSRQLQEERAHLDRIKKNVAKVLRPRGIKNIAENKDLLYKFRIQINKLITSENFDSKLKKLTSFLRIDDMPSANVSELEDRILGNVLLEIQNLKKGTEVISQLQRMKVDYQQKMKEQLKMQQINLKADFLEQLNAKDMELRKMIAELEQRLINRPGVGMKREVIQNQSAVSQVESQFSIDSDNVSWKADLWELLPESDKKKLYEKQTVEVTGFLTSLMMQQLKEEGLDRSLDISFEFPEDFERPNQPTFKTTATANNSESFKKKDKSNDKSSLLGDLPKLPPTKTFEGMTYAEETDQSNQNVQTIERDALLKPKVVKILANYKQIYLRRKSETVKKILKMLQSKEPSKNSAAQQIKILTDKQIQNQHLLYVRAYEERLIWSLIGVYSKCSSKSIVKIEEEMKVMYDRLVVVCQVETAEECIGKVSLEAYQNKEFKKLRGFSLKKTINLMEEKCCPLEVGPNELYIALRTKEETDKVERDLVEMITNLLTLEFAKEFPKKTK